MDINQPNFVMILVLLLIWDLIWKGLSLWKAARNNQSAWFIALILINSLGLLPIIYLKFFQNSRAVKTLPGSINLKPSNKSVRK